MDIEEQLRKTFMDAVWPEISRRVDERLAAFTPGDREPWMDTVAAAKYLGLSEQALRKRAKRGSIPGYQDETGRWLFRYWELDDWVTRRSC